jgi:hypothetical protein
MTDMLGRVVILGRLPDFGIPIVGDDGGDNNKPHLGVSGYPLHRGRVAAGTV